MIKKEVVIIDAACNVKKDARLRASYLTPKIGGVGPVTVSLLIKNVVRAARTRSEKDGTERFFILSSFCFLISNGNAWQSDALHREWHAKAKGLKNLFSKQLVFGGRENIILPLF